MVRVRDLSKLPRHDILCVDMKSFYATCECLDHGFDPMKKKLAVVGKIDNDGSVVLAASPALKKLGITTGSRLFEIKAMNDKSIFVAQARMGFYQKVSNQIRGIFEQFVPPDHIDIYSVDEAWLTLDGTRDIWGSAWEAAQKIREAILTQTGIIATVGIGDNKFLAKAVLDNYGKHELISECRYEDVPYLLHPLPVGEMWGVGRQFEKHFQKMKIYTIRELAEASEEIVQKTFGKIGVKLVRNANGIDDLPVLYKDNKGLSAFGLGDDDSKSIGRGVTLWEDYRDETSILLIVKELIDEVTHTLRSRKKIAKVVHLSIEYSRTTSIQGFSRQKKMDAYTNDASKVFNVAKVLFAQHHVANAPVRFVRISIGDLAMEEEEVQENLTPEDIKSKNLAAVQDALNNKFGKGTIAKATSLQKNSISKEQNKKRGGHYE